MKKLIALFAAIILTGSLSVFAEPTEIKGYFSKQSSYELTFTKIVIQDDIDLVIYENATSNIQFDGSTENIAKVEWKIKKGVLYINSKRGSLKNKVMVTIDVKKLSEISIEGNSSVRSLGVLNSNELNVYVKSQSYVALRSTGSINIINTSDSEMDVKEQIGKVTIR